MKKQEEITDEMVEKSLRLAREAHEENIRADSHREGHQEGIKYTLQRIRNKIDFLKRADREWKEKGFSLKYANNTRRINILEEFLTELQEVFDIKVESRVMIVEVKV